MGWTNCAQKEAVRRLKCPFDSEEAHEAKGKDAKAKAKGPYDQRTQSLTSVSALGSLDDGNDVAYAVKKSGTNIKSELRIKANSTAQEKAIPSRGTLAFRLQFTGFLTCSQEELHNSKP